MRARILRIEDAEMKVGLTGLGVDSAAPSESAAPASEAAPAEPPAEEAPSAEPAPKKKRTRKKADEAAQE